MNRKVKWRKTVLLPVAVGGVVTAVFGGTCIISGSTASAPASSLCSAPVALCSGPLSAQANPVSVDARYRTILASPGIGLDPRLANGCMIIVR